MLWYLNVHASPHYQWQKCQALLHPHMDNTVIQNQEYVYRGDPHVITTSHGNSMRQSGLMMDLDEALKMAGNHARCRNYTQQDLKLESQLW